MSKAKTTEQFVEEAQLKHGHLYDYSKVCYINSQTKVTIICKKHGEFQQRPNDHLQGKRCLQCYGAVVSNTNDFVTKSKLIHNDLYNYSKVDYTRTDNKVTVICQIHGEFKQRPSDHLKGKGCPKCGGKLKSNTNDFITRSKQKHGDLYCYDKTNYSHIHSKVIIICKHHGEFTQTPNSHLHGRGCPKCGGRLKGNTNDFITRSKLIHNDLYDYSQVNYTNNGTKVQIICKTHGPFQQIPNAHLRGQGCPKCGTIERLNVIQSKGETEFLDWLEVPNDNRQYPIGKYFVDGVVNNTIYEFLGDYWHGHGKLEKGLNYIDIQIKRWLTAHRFSEIQKLTGFNIKYVWESDWNEFNKVGGRLKLRTFDGKMQW